MYAARLATALRARTGAKLFGMGGPRMAKRASSSIADYHEVAVVGIAEVLHKIPTVIGVQNRLAREAERRGAALAILVDSPGTHLGVARRLKKQWDSRRLFHRAAGLGLAAGRVRVVKRLVERMVVIFPFEEEIYRDAGVPVDFVGHPLVDAVQADDDARGIRGAARASMPSRPIVTLLPGSRPNEIAQNYARIIEACERHSQRAEQCPIRARRRAGLER